MDQERARIQADLRGLLEGDIRCDDVFLQMYSSDASIFEVKPLGVVRPRNTADVVACVEYAAENKIPLHARGAGTGVAGGALGRGLLIDFSHWMRRIVRIDEQSVRVQPGVFLSQLNRRLADVGRCFGPDPANQAVTTMGGVISVDGGGSHWLRHGSTRQHVESLQVVLADGQVVELNRHAVHDSFDPADTVSRLAAGVHALVESNQQLILDHYPQSVVNGAGYGLDGVIQKDKVNLARLLVGAEGTLGLITEATVRTMSLPRHTGVALILFDRLENAANAALEVSRMNVSACDLMDRRLLRLACESDVRFDVLLPSGTEALLLVERDGAGAAEVREALQQIVHFVRRRRKLAFDARIAIDNEDRDLYWRLARRVVPTLYRLKGSTRPLPFVEDIAVPPAELPSFLIRLQNALKRHQITASLFAHAGHGQIHMRPFLDLSDPEHVRRMEHLARDLYAEVLEVRGTISGEHGDGLSRTWYLRELYGPLYDTFVQLKRLFDPEQIMNPGKIVDERGQSLTQNLRPVSTPLRTEEELSDSSEPDTGVDGPRMATSHTSLPILLQWADQDVTHAARSCNGCGGCRTVAASERMCPIFRVLPSEEATPRAKANLMRAVLTGRLDATELNGETLKQIADLCVNCHQCRLECPAHVDIPKLVVECKAQYVTNNGLSPSEWLLARLDLVSSYASLVRPLANWALANRHARWLLEKMFGIAQGRKLPRLESRSFLRRASRRRLTRPARRSGRKVLYFLDIYATWYDHELAESLVAILEHNGVSVFVHPRQQQAGMAMITMGAVERARRIARHNVTLLADAVRQGYHIVTTEPAATLCLTREYRYLLDDEDSALVASHTSEACSYLWKMHQLGQLELDLKPLNLTVGYHQPCHLKALEVGSPGDHLLQLVPGLSVRRIEQGCSGMAGTYGLKQENYRNSLRAGWGLITALRQPDVQVGATECCACKMQMEQGTTKPTIHPLKLLALAYGLMPKGNRWLKSSSQDLTLS